MMPSGVPLEALREVQEGLTNNMWMLGLPELAPFRSFIMDAAAQCEAGTIERALRDVRREAKEEREEQHRQGTNGLSPAAEARAIEEVVRTRATAVLPKRSHDAPQPSLSGATRPRSFSQAQLLAFGPTIHLVRAAVYPDLTRGLKVTHRKPHRRPCLWPRLWPRLRAAPPPTRAASRPSDPPPLSHPPHQHPTLPPKHTPLTRPARRGASWMPSSSSCRSGWWTPWAAAWVAWRSGRPSTACSMAPNPAWRCCRGPSLGPVSQARPSVGCSRCGTPRGRWT